MTLDEWYAKTRGVLVSTAEKLAIQTEQWAKKNHPWKNRSGNAERALAGYLENTEHKVGFGIGFDTSVDYGKYLETKDDGKYGICNKAMDHFKPVFDEQIKAALGKRPGA